MQRCRSPEYVGRTWDWHKERRCSWVSTLLRITRIYWLLGDRGIPRCPLVVIIMVSVYGGPVRCVSIMLCYRVVLRTCLVHHPGIDLWQSAQACRQMAHTEPSCAQNLGHRPLRCIGHHSLAMGCQPWCAGHPMAHLPPPVQGHACCLMGLLMTPR